MKLNVLRVVTTLVVSLSTSTVFGQSATQQQDRVKRVVDEAIRPVMQHDGIPGMAVGIIGRAVLCLRLRARIKSRR